MTRKTKRPARRKTNIEIVTELMTYSDYGGLVQAFVIDALAKWSAIVAARDPAEFDSALLNGRAWVGVAAEVKAKLDAHYGAAEED